MSGDLVQASGLGEELDHPTFAIQKFGLVAAEPLEKRVSTIEQADVMRAQVIARLESSDFVEADREVFQTRPHVSIEGAEAG